MKIKQITLSIILSLLCITSTVSAKDVSSMFSPGVLAEGHKKSEGILSCIDCHSPLGGIPDKNCLSCHKKIKKRVKDKTGYHANVSGRCFDCHSDHKGRGFKMVKMDIDSFDHGKTGYSLKNKHKGVECRKCHKKKNTYLDVPVKCVSCHKDIHKGELGNKCENCHTTKPWKNLIFEHNKDSKYKLEGKHEKVKCNACHLRETYKVKKADRCITCHKKDDKHKNALGGKCFDCHSVKGWKLIKFNHSKTDYKLTGQHNKVSCVGCHKKIDKKVKNITYEKCSTSGCHDRKKDKKVHGKQFKEKDCTVCHSTKNWKPTTFVHNNKSYKGFKLEGKHKKTACVKCHEKGIYSPVSYKRCDTEACHGRPVDQKVHAKQFGDKDCSACHKVFDWKPSTFLHNGKAYKGFKLEGKHEKLECVKCHEKGKYAPIAYKRCDTELCHGRPADQKVHGKQFVDKDCSACHNVSEWKPSTFLHKGKDYKGFKLEGKHEKTECVKCHEKGAYTPIAYKRCDTETCHGRPVDQKVHGKQFGDKDCSACHNLSEWKPSTFLHNGKTYKGFKLKGKHEKVECVKCHEKGTYAPIAYKRCDTETCHGRPVDQKVHGKQFVDKDCSACHNLSEWKPSTFLHNGKVYKGFRLKGKHEKLECVKCHEKGAYTPIPYNRCDTEFCHSRPSEKNVHGNQFGNRDCDVCHTEKTWKPSTFEHDSSSYDGFRLKGKHKKTECVKCHQEGKYIPLESALCSSAGCHSTKKDKDVHGKQFGEKDCSECHSEKSWTPFIYKHEEIRFLNKGAHRNLMCSECHKKQGSYISSRKYCGDCHRDPHFNQFGSECDECHTVKSWLPTLFKHNRVGFRLAGGHRQAECKDCHQNRNYRNIPTDCYSCHRSNYQAAANHVARNYSTDCKDCHVNIFAWTFKHNNVSSGCSDCHSSDAPAAHITSNYGSFCEDCHAYPSWTFKHNSVSSGCSDCHLSDAPAAHTTNSYGTVCEDCHSYPSWTFSHGSASNNCYQCHSADFSSSHTLNGYSTDCTECHSYPTWSFNHSAKTSFPTNHKGTSSGDCSACHPGSDYSNGGGCIECHNSRGAKVHETNSNSRCLSCHPYGSE